MTVGVYPLFSISPTLSVLLPLPYFVMESSLDLSMIISYIYYHARIHRSAYSRRGLVTLTMHNTVELTTRTDQNLFHVDDI